MNDGEITTFLAELSAEVRKIVLALRKVIRRNAPQAEETFVWGGLSYHHAEIGGRVKGAVCQIVAKRGQVRLDFIHGIRLADPDRLLRGNRVSKRFVPIRSVAEAEHPAVAALIREAAAVDPRKWGKVDRASGKL